MRATSTYLLTERDDAVFGLYHASADPVGAPVLICPPWGWDEVASHRTRWLWAERLAEAGHPTLRFDLPGCGDSDGTPAAAGLVDRWVAATAAAAEWLRSRAAADRVAALGLGLGGLLVQEAIARGAPIEAAAIWASPPSGRHFVREMRAFSRLQEGRPTEEPGGAALPPDWLEAGGFLLSAETLTALRDLDPALGGTGLRRVLLLQREGIGIDAGVRARFELAGAEVLERPGPGWAAMVGHPETTALPDRTAAEVLAWLGLDGAGAGRALPLPASAACAVLEVEGTTVRETPIGLPAGFGQAFGILAEPEKPASPGLCALFLNAGAVRHVGPNRLWVETARRYAARGVPSVRVDLEGIGEADGDASRLSSVADFYEPTYVDQVRAMLAALRARGLGKKFLLVGLCAGAYWAFQAALGEEDVLATALVNAGALTWHEGILEQRRARRFDRLFQRRWWGRLVRGEVRFTKVLGFGALAVAKLGLLVRRLFGRGPGAGAAIVADLESLRPGLRVAMAFSHEEPLYVELEALGILDSLDRWPGVSLSFLPGTDHTLRSALAQRRVSEFLDDELSAVAELPSPAQDPSESGRQR